MDILKNYAKTTNKEPTEVTSIRVPRSVYNAFKNHCEGYGLSMAEAINILIKAELGDTYQAPTHEDVTNNLHDKLPKQSSSLKQVTTKKPLSSQPSRQAGRFLTTEYQVGNDLPCPICNKWYSHSNFARHAKQNHGKTTQEIFTENHEKAILMVKTKTS